MKPTLLLLLPLTFLSAQTADEIVAKHIEARGSAAKFAALQSVRVTGRIKLGDDPFGPFSVLATASGKFRLELTAGTQQILQRYDGKTAWQANEPVSGGNATQILDQAIGAVAGPLWDYKNRRIQVESGGHGKWKDHEVLILRVTLPTGTRMVIYLNPATYLEIGEELFVKINGQDAVIEETVADDRRFGGVLFPCTFVSGLKGQPSGQRLEIQDIQINPTIDDSVFRAGVSATGH